MKLPSPYDMRTHLIPDGDDVRFAWQQDTSGALARNKAIRDNAAKSRKFAPDVEHMASIPTIIYEQWMREFGLSWPPTSKDLEWCLTKVQDPEFKYFRTSAS